jgi:hypothetical protein
MIFKSLEDAEAYSSHNKEKLYQLQKEAESVPGVVNSDVWLNGNCPSYVVGVDNDDKEIVCFKL